MVSAGLPTAAELGQLVNNIPEPAILIGASILAIGYYAYTNIDRRAFESFEKKPLDQKVTEDLKFRLKKLGTKTDKKLLKDMDEICNIKYYDKYKQRDDLIIAPDKEHKRPDEEDMSEVYVFMGGPRTDDWVGKLKYAKWLTFDYFDKEGQPNIYVVDSDSVEKRHNHFVLDPEIEFLPTTYAGIMVQDTTSAANVVQQISTLDAEGKLVNSASEFISKVEHFEIEHLKTMNELDKEAELEDKRMKDMYRNS